MIAFEDVAAQRILPAQLAVLRAEASIVAEISPFFADARTAESGSVACLRSANETRPSCGMSQCAMRARQPIVLRARRASPTSWPSLIRHTPKGAVVLQADLRHLDVALLEDLQRQRAARERAPC